MQRQMLRTIRAYMYTSAYMYVCRCMQLHTCVYVDVCRCIEIEKTTKCSYIESAAAAAAAAVVVFDIVSDTLLVTGEKII